MMQLGLVQRLAQCLELGPGLEDPCKCLSGSPEDLETLLTDCPQEDKQGRINYLLSGGWAVEMLTNQKREHHDLDIINLSRVPLSWRVDEQKPRNYFGIISMRPQDLLDNHTQQIEWNMSEFYPEISDSQFEVYVPSNEYLFLSKIAGFLREPRNKDYSDLETLSGIIEPNEETISRFGELLDHVPGMHSQFHKNKQLFTDLSEYFKHLKGASRKIAGAYLAEIVKNFNEGNSDFAKKQASKFHDTLKRVYEQGLQECVSLKEEGIDYGKFENAWAEKKLSGFWVKDNGDVDLRIPKTQFNLKQLDHLRFWQDVENLNGVKLNSLERAVAFSKVFVAEIGVAKDKQVLFEGSEDKYGIVTKDNPGLEAVYWKINLIPSSKNPNTERFNGFIEGQRFNLEDKEKGQSVVGDIFTKNGKLLFSFIPSDTENNKDVLEIYKWLIKDSNYENMKKLEEYSVANEDISKEKFESARMEHYQDLLIHPRDYKEAKNFGRFIDDETKVSAHKQNLKLFLKWEDYKGLKQFEKEFEVEDTDNLKQEHIENLLDKSFRSDRHSSWIAEESLKKTLEAQKYLQAEIPKMEVNTRHKQLISERKYSLADRFAKEFNLREDAQKENQERELNCWKDYFKKREGGCFAIQGIKKFSEHYKQPLEREFVEHAIEISPECADAYLLIPEGELSKERAIKAYGLLLKERRVGPAEKMRNTYGIDSSVDYKLFCENPFIFADRRALDSLDIPIDKNSQNAALKFTESLMFDKGHRRKEKAKKVIEKFGIPYERVFEIACKNFDRQIGERNFDRLRKQYCDLALREKILDADDIDKYMMKKAKELIREGDYSGAEYIAHEILGSY